MPFHPLWLAVILVVVLIIFGPGRLPELGGAVGKAMREFRKATSELTNEVTSAARATPVEPPPPAATTVESTPAKGQESTSSSHS
jgi:sec-independent protein translocase protein TatA